MPTALTRSDITDWTVVPTSPVPVQIPDGGLPASVPDVALAEATLEQGLAPRPLSAYYVGATPGNGLVLGYGLTDVARIPELVDRLVRAREKLAYAG